MELLIMLLAFIVALVVVRIPFVAIWNSDKKIHKGFADVVLSFGILGVFILVWSLIVSKYLIKNQVDNNFVWYCIFSFFGISATIWCYLRWDLRWKAKPKFEEEKDIIALKKMFVFTIVMLFAFYHGYKQMDAIFKDVKVDSTLTLYNVTIVSGIIALDRVLNQVTIVYNEWEKKKKE